MRPRLLRGITGDFLQLCIGVRVICRHNTMMRSTIMMVLLFLYYHKHRYTGSNYLLTSTVCKYLAVAAL